MNPADLVQQEGATMYPRAVKVATPAVGAEVSIAVPGGFMWEVISLSFQLVTSAVAGTRAPRLTVDDGTNIFFQIQAAATQATGTTLRHTFAKWLGTPSAPGAPTVVAQALPELILSAGYRITTSTAAIDVGDQYSLIVAYVYETVLSAVRRPPERLERGALIGAP